MGRTTLAVLAVILSASTVLAQEDAAVAGGSFMDDAGDAAADLDILYIQWTEEDIAVTVGLAENLQAGAALTAVLYAGIPGEDEPGQAYILHHGPQGDRALAGKGGSAPDMDVEVANGTVTFHLNGALSSDCVFAVARTVTYPEGGQQVEDVVGWTGDDIEDAWDGGAACADVATFDGVHNLDEESFGAPGVTLPVTLGAIAVLVMVRRTQR